MPSQLALNCAWNYINRSKSLTACALDNFLHALMDLGSWYDTRFHLFHSSDSSLLVNDIEFFIDMIEAEESRLNTGN